MNHSLGKWTNEETNWSKDDNTFVEKALVEKLEETSYKKLLEEHEAKLLENTPSDIYPKMTTDKPRTCDNTNELKYK